MNKRIIGLIAVALVLLLVAGAVLSGCSGTGATSAPTPTAQAKVVASTIVSAEGTVLPVQRATLAFKIGGRVVELPVHEGDGVQAGSVLARLDDKMVVAQVAQAQASLNVAQKQLAQLKTGGTAADRQAAQNALVAAQAALAKVKAGPTADQLGSLKAAVDAAQAGLGQAQFRYDRIGGASNPFGGAAPESLALQQAYTALASSQAAYRDAAAHPTDSEVKAAESAVSQAQSALARLDPTPDALALADAQVTQAQAALSLVTATAQDTVLAAPFAGSVASVDVQVGDVVSPGAVAVSVANLSKLEVETVDLTEVDVAKVAIGQAVNIKVDAFPGKIFTGQVARIAAVASDHRGDKVYKVTIDLQPGSETGLRWGMTANVDIQVGK
jgi:HlyD family secretion protein